MQVAIAGAGIMGRLLAWRLCRQGCRLSLFDRDPIEHGEAAAYTAAGMLTPYSEVESAELTVYRMGMQSLGLWPEIIASLKADVGFCQRGSLIVAHAADRADLQRFNQQLRHKLQPSRHKLQQLNAGKLRELEPELAERFGEASFLPEEAWLDTGKVMQALAAALLANSVTWHAETPVDETGSGYLRAGGEKHRFDWVIDCRGLGAKPELPEVRGVRGEVLELYAPDVCINRLVRLMHPRYRLYVVPRPDNIYLVGATQIESDDRGPITVRSSLELLSAAYSMHAGFAEARVLSSSVNCRPALNDNLPAVHYCDGLIRVNGLFRHGYLLAPVLAQEVGNWLAANGQYQSAFEQLFKARAAWKSIGNHCDYRLAKQ